MHFSSSASVSSLSSSGRFTLFTGTSFCFAAKTYQPLDVFFLFFRPVFDIHLQGSTNLIYVCTDFCVHKTVTVGSNFYHLIYNVLTDIIFPI